MTPTSPNTEIERKYFTNVTFEEYEDAVHHFTSVCHDRYYISPGGLIRLRHDKRKGIELTAKEYKLDNLHRREINLGLPPAANITDCLEFAEVAGWTLRLEFKQNLKIWITNEVCISETEIWHSDKTKPYRFNPEQLFITDCEVFPVARFIEIEALPHLDILDAQDAIGEVQEDLGITDEEIIPFSLIQLFGAYPRS